MPRNLTGGSMQALFRLWPEVLTQKLLHYYEHHMMVKVSVESIEETRQYFNDFTQSIAGNGEFASFECTTEEGKKAFLHRFSAADAAIRYAAVHHHAVEDIVALDNAWPRQELEW